jgi:hypothetical protein
MTLSFEIEKEPTLDSSYPVIVRSVKGDCDEEYVFQFACNVDELQDLQQQIKEAIAYHIKTLKEDQRRKKKFGLTTRRIEKELKKLHLRKKRK